MFDCGPTGRQFKSASNQGTLTFPPVVLDWVNKGLGMSSCVCATRHIKDPVPLMEKSSASCPSGRFPPSFIHQVILITGLNKTGHTTVCQEGIKVSLKLKLFRNSTIFCKSQVINQFIWTTNNFKQVVHGELLRNVMFNLHTSIIMTNQICPSTVLRT